MRCRPSDRLKPALDRSALRSILGLEALLPAINASPILAQNSEYPPSITNVSPV